MKKNSILLILGMTLASCAPKGYEALNEIASQTVQSISCKDQALETKLWDGLKTFLLEQKALPSAEVMSEAFRQQLEVLAQENPQLSHEDISRLQQDLDRLAETLLDETVQGERVETPEQLLILLSAMDVGDRSTVFRSYLQNKVQTQFKSLHKTIQSFDLNCTQTSASTSSEEVPKSEVTPTGPSIKVNVDYEYHKQQELKRGGNLAVFGGRWTFATAYQSCQSILLPAMTEKTPEVMGISIVGKHTDGVGSKRMIASLSQVQSTHYYVKETKSFGEGCFNVRQSPLIYDYGGKPYGTTAANSPIDLFKNNGDGTSVLGIDCSGFIYTLMATAGLRLKSGRPLKASDSWAWGSSSYVEPQKNGLTCLNKISVTPISSLLAGDIVAVYGHVLLIDTASADPFGIAQIKSESECSKISSDQFDFVVAQSAPSKGGVGINYFAARDYLPTSSKMKAGLEKYAYYACLAKVNGRTYTPNLGTLSVVRHKGTSECMAPRVTLVRESCIQSCSSFVR